MRYELSHDIVARQVFDKASAEAQTRRKIEKYIADRYAMYRERGALLTQDDLEYVRPHLDAIQPDAAVSAFIDASERAIRRRRNRVRLTVAGVMAVLIAATAYSLVARGEARRQARQANERQLIASATNALDDGRLALAGLMTHAAARASNTPAARSPLLTWHLKTARILSYLVQQEEPVSSVAFSPDGSVLATAGWDNVIYVHNLAWVVPQFGVREGPRSSGLYRHTDDVTAIAFSPDGATIASASNDSSIILWDWRALSNRLLPLRGHEAEVTAVAFSPDGRLLASASTSGDVILWNAADGAVVQRWRAHENGANSVAFTPDGHSIVSGGGDGRVNLRSVAATRDTWTVFLQMGTVNAVVLSRDGSSIAAATETGTVPLLDTKTGGRIGFFGRQPVMVASALAVSSDGHTLALGSWDGTVVQWDMQRPGGVQRDFPRGATRGPTLAGHTSPVLGVAFNPRGQMMASASEDGTVILWDVSDRPLLHASLRGHEGEVKAVAFSPDSRTLASVGSDGTARLWSAPFEDHQQPRVLRDQGGIIHALAFHPNGRLLATAGSGGVGLWDLATSTPRVEPLTGHQSDVFAVAFSDDGKLLASGGRDAEIIVWDVEKRVSQKRLRGHEKEITGLDFSPDGKWLASSSYDSRVILWDSGGTEDVPLLGANWPLGSVAFSPDGRTLASGSVNGLLLQWDVRTYRWRVLPRLQSDNSMTGVAFSADGQSIATSSWDGTVMIWDVARHQPRGEALPSHPPARVHATLGVAFSSDGRWLAAANFDGSVAVWSFATDYMLGRTCSVVGPSNVLVEELRYIAGRVYEGTCLDWAEAPAGSQQAPAKSQR